MNSNAVLKSEVITLVCDECGKTVQIDSCDSFCPECGALIVPTLYGKENSGNNVVIGEDDLDIEEVGIQYLGNCVGDFIIKGAPRNVSDIDNETEEVEDEGDGKKLAPIIQMRRPFQV